MAVLHSSSFTLTPSTASPYTLIDSPSLFFPFGSQSRSFLFHSLDLQLCSLFLSPLSLFTLLLPLPSTGIVSYSLSSFTPLPPLLTPLNHPFAITFTFTLPIHTPTHTTTKRKKTLFIVPAVVSLQSWPCKLYSTPSPFSLFSSSCIHLRWIPNIRPIS